MNEQVALWDIDETLTDYKAIKSAYFSSPF